MGRRSRRVQSYPHAVYRWRLSDFTIGSDGLPVFPNTGSISGHNMKIGPGSPAGSSPVYWGVPSILQSGVKFPTNNASGSGLIIAPSATPTAHAMISVSAWVCPLARNGTATNLIHEKLRVNDSTNDGTYSLGLDSSTSALRVSISTGANGSGTGAVFSASTPVPLGVFSLATLTYDGSYLRAYLNGMLDGETAKTGNIDWNTSGTGSFLIGVNAAVSNSNFPGIVEEVVVEDAVISENMLRARYLRGLGLFPDEAT